MSDALNETTSKTWAAVDADGVRHEVAVEDMGSEWRATLLNGKHEGAHARAPGCAHAAVMRLAWVCGWLIVEVLAPGVPSRAEMAEAQHNTLMRLGAAHAEVARSRVELDHERTQVKGLAVERNHYRERAAAHHARADRNQSIAAEAMREGHAACEALRVELADALEAYDRVFTRMEVAQAEAYRLRDVETALRAEVAYLWKRRGAWIAEGDRLRRSVAFSEEWYGVRWERLADLLRGTDLWPRVCDIMANGTDGAQEPPTYAQQLVLAKHAAKSATGERDAAHMEVARLRAELDHERACSMVKCGACGGRGKVLCAREVEDGCDDCEASGLVPAAAEVDRLAARVTQLEAALNAAMIANVARLGEMEAQVERVAAERDEAVRESIRRAWLTKERARALAARYADDSHTLRRMLTEMSTSATPSDGLEAASPMPPDAETIEAHEAAHGGYWLVSRVAVGDGLNVTRPMVLRLSIARSPRYTWVRATFPGHDVGGVLGVNAWKLMECATFTPLDANGVMLLSGGPRG